MVSYLDVILLRWHVRGNQQRIQKCSRPCISSLDSPRWRSLWSWRARPCHPHHCAWHRGSASGTGRLLCFPAHGNTQLGGWFIFLPEGKKIVISNCSISPPAIEGSLFPFDLSTAPCPISLRKATCFLGFWVTDAGGDYVKAVTVWWWVWPQTWMT